VAIVRPRRAARCMCTAPNVHRLDKLRATKAVHRAWLESDPGCRDAIVRALAEPSELSLLEVPPASGQAAGKTAAPDAGRLTGQEDHEQQVFTP
jgi:hypothetical protein